MRHTHLWMGFAIAVLIGHIGAAADDSGNAFSIEGTIVSFDTHDAGGAVALLTSSWRDGLQIEIIDGHTGARTGHISSGHAPTSSSFSPDGKTLLFVDTTGAMQAFDTATQTTTAIPSDSAAESVFPAWSPQGTRIAYCQRPRDRSAGMASNVFILDLATSKSTPVFDDPSTLDTAPSWSPDGVRLLFQRMSMGGPRPGRSAWIVDPATHEAFPLLPEVPGDGVVNARQWAPDSQAILVVKTRPGQQDAPDIGSVSMVHLSDSAIAWTLELPGVEDALFFPDGAAVLVVKQDALLWVDARDGRVISQVDLAETGPCARDVTGPAIRLGRDVRDVTFLSEGHTLYRAASSGDLHALVTSHPEPLPTFEHEEYFVISPDGLKVPVKRFVPANPRPAAIMLVIGGPGAPIDVAHDPLLPLLLDAGYEVIAPAYRGCAGYGPEHLAANRGEWGRGDVADVTAAANDWKQQHKDRPLVLAGYSYGGYLTLLALARHDAPWDAGITLWGMVSIQQPLLAMLEATLPTDTLARKHALAERAPLDQATAIARPLLILHGALDGAATIEEVNSLHGRISQSELIIYPNDGHGLFLNRPDMLQQLNAFIERTPR